MRHHNTLHKQRDYDFQKILEALSQESLKGLTLNKEILELLKPSHEKIFYFKHLIDLKQEWYLEDSKDFFTACISMLIECILQISIGRYRTTHILLRSSLEALCSGIFIELLNKNPDEKFSQNIDQIKKELIAGFTINFDKRKRKLFRRTVHNYVDNSIKKDLYWMLSDYVHSTKREFLSTEEYIEDMLGVVKTQTSVDFENTLIVLNKVLNNLILLTLISDYDFYIKEPREIVRFATSKFSSQETDFLNNWYSS
ncbi:hypothetical protein [Exiguobacterium sp. RIT594]|uniref:hypothetical protein n=1 Tax=Exiguobacterium sp. RIT594 TaxID=2282449 RepID=UPI000DF8155C|nr:hypothetical protein [Exiguobacterium sp. RIT594]RDB32001.1 hypothetical protein DVG79_15500 [Exiguobacterium sp. RIT594]